jgi:hypothetical protein
MPTLVFSPSSIQFNALDQTVYLTLVSGPNVNYTFSTSNANVATAQYASGYAVTSVGPGTANITISTPGYQPFVLPVSVAQIIIIPQNRRGHR